MLKAAITVNKKSDLFVHLLCAMHWVKSLVVPYLILISSLWGKNHVFSFYRGENEGLEKLNNLPKTTQLVSVELRSEAMQSAPKPRLPHPSCGHFNLLSLPLVPGCTQHKLFKYIILFGSLLPSLPYPPVSFLGLFVQMASWRSALFPWGKS